MYVWNLQRHGGWTWGGGNLSSMSASVSLLGDSGWLIHIQSVLAGAAWIAARVAMESASVLVHCRLATLTDITGQLYYLDTNFYPCDEMKMSLFLAKVSIIIRMQKKNSLLCHGS